MSASTAADRLDDSFPHGTPAGFTLGCKGAGGCPNRDTARMTCRDANLRYASDLAYRRAYQAGDIWLDQPAGASVDDVRERRAARRGPDWRLPGERGPMSLRIQSPTPVVREAMSTPGPVETPTPAPTETPRTAPTVQPAPAPTETRPAPAGSETFQPPENPRERGWRHGQYGYSAKGCRCDICTEAHREAQRAGVRRNVNREIEQLRAENAALRADIERLTAPAPTPARTSLAAHLLPDGGIQIRFTGVEALAVLDPASLQLLADRYRVADA